MLVLLISAIIILQLEPPAPPMTVPPPRFCNISRLKSRSLQGLSNNNLMRKKRNTFQNTGAPQSCKNVFGEEATAAEMNHVEGTTMSIRLNT